MIFAKMQQVMKRIDNLSKDKKLDSGGGYRYLSEEKVTAELHEACAELGIIFAPVSMEILAERDDTTQRGGLLHNVHIRVGYQFTDAEDGSVFQVMTLGEGSDSGDKAVNKAMTAAFKYALRESFLISTGDDPDDTASEPTASSTRRAVAPALANGSGLAPSINPTYRETFHDEIFHELTRLELMNGNHPSPRAEEIGLLHGMPCWASKWGTANNATLIAFVDALKAMTE